MMTFLNSLDALIPKIPFSFFSDFWVWVTSEARGSVSVGFWGSCQLSPFWGRGGSGRRALSTPPPPRKRKPVLPRTIKLQPTLKLSLDDIDDLKHFETRCELKLPLKHQMPSHHTQNINKSLCNKIKITDIQ